MSKRSLKKKLVTSKVVSQKVVTTNYEPPSLDQLCRFAAINLGIPTEGAIFEITRAIIEDDESVRKIWLMRHREMQEWANSNSHE